MNHAVRAIATVLGLAAAAGAWAEPLSVVPEGFPPEGKASVIADVRTADAKAAAWFGTRLPGPVTVRWVTDEHELRALGAGFGGSVAGLAVPERGLVALFAPALVTQPGRISGVLLHELCHLHFAVATAGAEVLPPRWLNEGVAMWRSGEWDLGLDWRHRQSNLLTDAAAAGSLIPLAGLDTSFPEGPFFHLAYAESQSFVEWLVNEYGEEKLRDFLRGLDRDLDPAPAFEAAFGVPLAEAEKDWRRSLGTGWLGFLPSAGTLVTGLWILVGLLMAAKFVRTRLQLRRATDDDE